MRAYSVDFAKRGYVSAEIRYRLATDLKSRGSQLSGYHNNHSTLPPFLLNAQHDTQAAVRWLRKNAATYNIDPDRIIVAGSSAGAITSLYAAYNYEDPGNSGNPGFSSKPSAVVAIMGGMYFDPGIWMRAGDPSALFVIGDKDPFYSHANITKKALEDLGIATEMKVYKGAGHTLQCCGATSVMAQFLYKHVIGEYVPILNDIPIPTSSPSGSSVGECEVCIGSANIGCTEGLICQYPSVQEPLPGQNGVCVKSDGTSLCGQAPTSAPTPIPEPMILPHSQKDIDSTCNLLDKYANLDNYLGTEKENEKLQQLIAMGTKLGLNKVDITSVDSLIEFYSSYCD